MLRDPLLPVKRLCEARLTKRSASEVRLGVTVVRRISLIGKSKILSSGFLCPGEKYGWADASATRKGKSRDSGCACGVPEA